MILNNNNNFKTLIFIFVFSTLSLIKPAEAGIFKILLNAGQEAAEVGSKAGRKLDTHLPALSHLPDEVGVSKVGLEVDSTGSLSLLAESGQKWPFSQGDDITQIIADIKKTNNLSSGKKTNELKFYLSSTELFNSFDNPLLKKIDNLNLTHGGKAYPLSSATNKIDTGWQIQARENLYVDIKSHVDLKESLFRVNQPINLANMRLVSFSTGTEGFPSKIQVASKTELPDVTMIHPDYLENSLNILKHQSLVITGKRVGDFLKIKDPKGKESAINLKTLQNEAAKNDVNLLIIESTSSAQPGSKLLPWNKSVKQKQLQQAFSSETYGDFLSSFTSNKTPISLIAEQTDNNFVSFRALPKKGSVVSNRKYNIDEEVSGIEIATHITLHAARLYTKSEDYENELGRRIVSSIPSWVHTILLINIVSGLLVHVFSYSLWGRLWRPEEKDDFDSWLKYALHCFVYFSLYIIVFLGLFGAIFLLVRALIWIYNFLLGIFYILTWPFRFIIALFSR